MEELINNVGINIEWINSESLNDQILKINLKI